MVTNIGHLVPVSYPWLYNTTITLLSSNTTCIWGQQQCDSWCHVAMNGTGNREAPWSLQETKWNIGLFYTMNFDKKLFFLYGYWFWIFLNRTNLFIYVRFFHFLLEKKVEFHRYRVVNYYKKLPNYYYSQYHFFYLLQRIFWAYHVIVYFFTTNCPTHIYSTRNQWLIFLIAQPCCNVPTTLTFRTITFTKKKMVSTFLYVCYPVEYL